MTNKIVELIRNFVDKSGGIDKVNEARDAIKKVASQPGQASKLVAGLAKNEAGSKQLLAAALLGFSIASFLYDKKDQTKQ
jgi:hypothetical protein